MTVTHRMTKTATWRGMVERCTNPKNNHWHIYGARGISVCARWRSFENFLVAQMPAEGFGERWADDMRSASAMFLEAGVGFEYLENR